MVYMKAVELFQLDSMGFLRFSWSPFSHGHQCRSPNDITCITQMSVLSLCVVHEGGKTSSASPWALVTGSLRLTRLAGTFAGCKRKLLLLN